MQTNQNQIWNAVQCAISQTKTTVLQSEHWVVQKNMQSSFFNIYDKTHASYLIL